MYTDPHAARPQPPGGPVRRLALIALTVLVAAGGLVTGPRPLGAVASEPTRHDPSAQG